MLSKDYVLNFNDFDFHAEILHAVDDLGFETPTPIQELMIPMLLGTPDDVVGLAHTGTGKTAAFGLPVINNIDIKNSSPQALILCPTRELCIQISAELEQYAKYIPGFSIASIYGGDSYERQLRALKKAPQIIAGTPGRLIDLLKKASLDISGIRYLVLDEADIMLNMGFKEEIDTILEWAPAERQTILLSATMPRDVAKIAATYMNDPIELSVGTKNAGTQQVEHRYYTVRRNEKYQTLKRIVDFNPGLYGIVFCRTRAGTQDVAEKMMKDGYNAEALHGDLSQAQREHVMNKFRARSVQLLVATDIAARGLDVDDLTHIIHYDLPTEADIYIHRSGRTGRAGKTGISLSIIDEKEKSRLRWIERTVKRDFKEDAVPGKHEICSQQLMQLIERVRSVEVDREQISQYLPTIEQMLSTLSREEIIERFVSLEFNKFFDYYRNLKDVKPASKPERHQKRVKNDKKKKNPKQGFDWLAVNVGRDSKVLPLDIIGLVNRSTRSESIRLGRIDIGNTKSWFQVESESIELVEESMQNATYKRRKLKIERAESSPGRARKTA